MDKKDKKSVEECAAWYNANHDLFELCGEKTEGLLRTLLEQKHLAFHSIEHRTKVKDSFLVKCASGKYSDPTSQITDICGLRIISYTKHDVNEISRLIEQEFTIDEKNSMDKSAVMEVDKVGYLSVHYVAQFNSSRADLPEYAPFRGLRFEIQIRTLLQHAWAEIEHDRSYKFSGELPKRIKRRFYLLAGTLELIDAEFDRLSGEIDQYAQDVKSNIQEDKLDVPIDSTSLMEYLLLRFPHNVEEQNLNGNDKEIVDELEAFGIHTLKDLDDMLSDGNVQAFLCGTTGLNYLGMLRHVMILKDPKTYFTKAWKTNWRAIDMDVWKKITALNPAAEKERPSIVHLH